MYVAVSADMSSVATEDRFSLATVDTSSVVTADMSLVATEGMYCVNVSVVPDDMSSVVTEDVTFHATEDMYCVAMHIFLKLNRGSRTHLGCSYAMLMANPPDIRSHFGSKLTGFHNYLKYPSRVTFSVHILFAIWTIHTRIG